MNGSNSPFKSMQGGAIMRKMLLVPVVESQRESDEEESLVGLGLIAQDGKR